jgi:hypothetical protein
MKAWCSWVLFILSFVAFSLVAESNSLVSWTLTSSTQSIINSQVSQKNLLDTDSLLSTDSLLDITIEVEEEQGDNSSSELKITTTDSKEFSSNTPPLIPTRVSAILLRDNLQTKPIYWLISEYNPPDLEFIKFVDSDLTQHRSPWFMQSNQRSNNRLSGWKDGNSLYTASITYH